MAAYILNKAFLFFSIILFNIGFSQIDSVDIPMNQIRILASHNSYKVKPTQKTKNFLEKFSGFLSKDNQPYQLDYGHLRIKEQLDSFNIRGFEFDVFNDVNGGRYYRHTINRFISKQKTKNSADSLLQKPGFKILHIPDIDYLTNYQTLSQALDELNAWSVEHQSHAPIFVNIELKASAMGDEASFLRLIGFHKALPFDKLSLAIMDSIFKSKLKTLDYAHKFQKEYVTKQERIEKDGWPLLSEIRGKIFVIIQGSGLEYYPTINAGAYLYGQEKNLDCIFMLKDNSQGNEKSIKALTQKYIIRTRSDAGTIEARNNDYSRLNSALESGAQIISTDYYKKDPEIGNFEIPFLYFIK